MNHIACTLLYQVLPLKGVGGEQKSVAGGGKNWNFLVYDRKLLSFDSIER
jgi:hypothetical protein